ncbi:hypothetical protein AB2L28_11990 [Kineococcus sp. TBRC 1896]|uniref:Uncharacterized protein n=1 Tax=Kineococcus mangrovi TaxID=1660183 RepID=A0ABV4I2P9_9ACTN
MRRFSLRDDSGYALAFVMIAMLVIAITVATTITIAIANTKPARATANSQAALSAAQAGVDDFVMRLNACDTYWRDAWNVQNGIVPAGGRVCGTSTDSPALTGGYGTTPGTDAAGAGRFRYRLVSIPDPSLSSGGIRLEVTGEYKEETRRITVDLRKEGFLRYIYYTDKESSSPTIMESRYGQRTITLDRQGSNTAFGTSTASGSSYISRLEYSGIGNASLCGNYYYFDGSGSVRRAASDSSTNFSAKTLPETATAYWNSGAYAGQWTINRSCEIQFGPNDAIRGKLYSKDALYLGGNSSSKPRFDGEALSFWQPSYSPAPRPNAPWRDSSSASGYDPDGQAPATTTQAVDLPPTNDQLKQVATSGGCVYSGPTKIVMRADGRYDVTSPRTTTSSVSCGSGLATGTRTVTGPANGVIYVDSWNGGCTDPTASGAASQKLFGLYPVTGDITRYTCRDGDAFVEGTVKGRYTIASANRVIVTNNVRYAAGQSASGTDVLGLISGSGNVEVYHPVGCTNGAGASAGTCVNDAPDFGLGSATQFANLSGSITDPVIHAALLSVGGSFTVQNYDKGQALGTLSVFGGIYQRQRGAVALSGSTGYIKDYVYDAKLVSAPPPSFIQPASDPWLVASFSEDQR